MTLLLYIHFLKMAITFVCFSYRLFGQRQRLLLSRKNWFGSDRFCLITWHSFTQKVECSVMWLTFFLFESFLARITHCIHDPNFAFKQNPRIFLISNFWLQVRWKELPCESEFDTRRMMFCCVSAYNIFWQWMNARGRNSRTDVNNPIVHQHSRSIDM